MILRTIALAALAAAVLPSQAAITINSSTDVYNQSFDTLATSGAAVAWQNDVTLAGWSLFRQPGTAITTYAAGTGSSNAGAFNSFGSSSDRALGGTGSGGSYFGSPASGAVAGWIAVSFTNGSGAALDSFTASFNGEQWRNGGNTSAQTMVMQYGFGNSFASVTDWTTPGGSFNWSSPVHTSTAAAINGNQAGLVSGLGGTIAVDWAADQTLWLRWAEVNDPGNDHGMGIDNFALSVTAVPEPGTVALMLAGLAAVGTMARRRRG